MSSRKCLVHYYVDENGEQRWRCGKYLMSSSVSFKMKSDKCYHYKCTGRKELEEICDWKDCKNPVAPNKLRHCSEVCRKRSNRLAYRQRQLLKKQGVSSEKQP